jgi:hypothetical protein
VETEEGEDDEGGTCLSGLIDYSATRADYFDLLEKVYNLDTSKPYPLTTQLNSVLSSLLSRLERNEVHRWTVHCLRPNDSGLGNSFDKKKVRAQVRLVFGRLELYSLILFRRSTGSV